MKTKASYTVEAALICPLICLLICAILAFTMRLYYQVEEYAVMTVREADEETASETVRLERLVKRLSKEVE